GRRRRVDRAERRGPPNGHGGYRRRHAARGDRTRPVQQPRGGCRGDVRAGGGERQRESHDAHPDECERGGGADLLDAGHHRPVALPDGDLGRPHGQPRRLHGDGYGRRRERDGIERGQRPGGDGRHGGDHATVRDRARPIRQSRTGCGGDVRDHRRQWHGRSADGGDHDRERSRRGEFLDVGDGGQDRHAAGDVLRAERQPCDVHRVGDRRRPECGTIDGGSRAGGDHCRCRLEHHHGDGAGRQWQSRERSDGDARGEPRDRRHADAARGDDQHERPDHRGLELNRSRDEDRGGPVNGAVAVTQTATVTVNPAAASTLAPHAGSGQTAPAGSAVPIAPSVIVTDPFGNPVSGVSVTFAPGPRSGSVTGATQTTDGSGIAAVGSWTLGMTAGGNTLTATSGSLSGSPVTFTATGTAGAAATIAANSPTSQSATAGTAVGSPPSVIVKDANGNPVAGVAVTFTPALGSGTVTPTTPVSTGSDGIAALSSWTLSATAGSNTLTATSGSLSGSPVTFTATGTAGAAATIAANSPTSQAATAGTAVTSPPSVIVKDANGNPVAEVAVTFTPAAGSGSVTGGTQTTNGSGIATVGSWTLSATAG